MKAIHHTFSPSEILKPYILFYSYIEMPAGMSCSIVPGTSFVMGFYSNGFGARFSDKFCKPLQQEVFGLQDRPRSFYSHQASRMVTVHFNNLGIQSFIKAPLHEIFNTEVSLGNFYKQQEVREIEERLMQSPNPEATIEVIDLFLRSQLKYVNYDPQITHALKLIRESKGQIPIKKLCDNIHCSQSLIEKKFKKALGLSPKKFASLVRFNSTIYNHFPNDTLTEKAYNAGYFDQAHFTRDFKSFTGFSPKAVFQNLENIGDFRVFGMSVNKF